MSRLPLAPRLPVDRRSPRPSLPRPARFERPTRGAIRAPLAVACVLLGGACLVVDSAASGNRPPEALEAERRSQAAELDHLIRRADALSSSLVERRRHLRQRLRALYKLSHGGYMRLFLGAETPAQMFSRRDAAERILRRDLDELSAVHDEVAELGGLRERLRLSEKRAAELEVEAREERPSGLAARGALRSPVKLRGPVVAGFGPYRDPSSNLEFTRDGVLLPTSAGDLVRSPASGVVRHIGDLPGLGKCIIFDNGDGWATLVGHLAEVRTVENRRVAAGEPIATAATDAVELQLSESGIWLDPLPYLGLPRP